MPVVVMTAFLPAKEERARGREGEVRPRTSLAHATLQRPLQELHT
jgi:hypothetical protein